MLFLLICFRELKFQQRTSTRSYAFSLLICLDSTTFLLLSVFTLTDTICPKILAETLPKNAKSPLPVDVRCLKTSLPQLPIRFGACEVSRLTVA